MQKEVKIIGIQLNQSLGILQSFNLKFDPNNKLIAIKGEVGSGKTTLQKSLSLCTQGSDTLKDDKSIYGEINQEVQLLDGENKIFVGCKSNEKGALDYVIYTKDSKDKIIKNPVIDGVKLTPSSYLKSLQTAMTWRMDELMSENSNTQKKILLELFKSELANLGVIFDKKSSKYKESILGRIELAESDRSEKEFLRKQVGGFLNQLQPLGIDPEKPKTYPTYIDLSDLDKQKNELQYKIDNSEEVKNNELSKLKNQADSLILKIKEKNNQLIKRNEEKEKNFELKKEDYSQHLMTKSGIQKDLKNLFDNNCIDAGGYEMMMNSLDSVFKPEEPKCEPLEQEIQFSEDSKVISKPTDFDSGNEFFKLLINLYELGKKYKEKYNEESSTTELEKELEEVGNKIGSAKTNNERLAMLNSFLDWKESNELVFSLKNEYANLLNSIDTGVEGLKIFVDKSENSKLDVYLMYDGSYDPDYFNNKEKVYRKLSSYSGTQKPLICLLLQNHLLSKKPKALRYLWIDNVPIDKKTRSVLEKMGNDLGVTIIVNITGDFSKDNLKNGEVLIEGGNVFFK